MRIIPVILSGGAGTRLWPLSWGDHPKQFLPLVSDKTMIQETLLRLKGLDVDVPIASCGKEHRFLVAQQLDEVLNDFSFNRSKSSNYNDLKNATILVEPMAKNTAPAIAAACCAALKRSEDAIVVVLPSDHVIKNIEAFQQAVKTAATYAEDGWLVTFGIVRTFASTGYGYVKIGKKNAKFSTADEVYDLDSFVEKPSLKKAQEYLASGEYCWNSGMFVFKASTFIEELKLHNSEMADLSIDAFNKAVVDTDFVRLDKNSFEAIEGNSIDYAVMEKTTKGKIVKLDAGWDDLGSWSALYNISQKDSNQNVIKGDVIALNTSNSYIHAGNRVIATIGLNNVAIVDSDDSLLIADMKCIQDVKLIAEQIKTRDK